MGSRQCTPISTRYHPTFIPVRLRHDLWGTRRHSISVCPSRTPDPCVIPQGRLLPIVSLVLCFSGDAAVFDLPLGEMSLLIVFSSLS